ncbi:hypothetical protein [Xanthomonas vesicatoria]|uniref:DUF4034 domain-containing protein n=1 Tax=Xanthomonas vesicatoria TaxID=56460 RepID=A0ABS8L6H9_9XANT|nr:hypothetical protein [Xanthomonas vesicatoria]MCC8620812.1 hypothetical protein [Xanthomonas vesicatoria]MCC8692551.1 hypothetical protein [Xanthomonas vesicatoria]MCC8700951.1 hypothetical protein [Xanthomonas vesicatoria]MDG4490891.1 hypothetical protein [Xanthomonas vesicatoria]
MKNLPRLVFATALIWIGPAHSATQEDFTSCVGDVAAAYERLTRSPESQLLIEQGRKSQVNARLKALVPDNEKTAIDYFVLSNMLYRSDIPASDAYMKAAEKALPGNPLVLFERAMHEHRAGHCAVALPLYERASLSFDGRRRPATLWAYVTHCRLVLGDAAGALSAWEKVNFREHHTAIEKAMYEIFSKANPDAEREQLIQSIATGDAGDACKLIKLDKNWEIDWWNTKEQSEFLKYDIALIDDLAKRNNKINLTAGICIQAVALEDLAFRNYVSSAGYWGNGFALPEDPAATYTLISELNKRKLATPAEILERYGALLEGRHQQAPDDRSTLDLLAFLYSANGRKEKLKRLDLYGWKTLHIQDYALSYVKGLAETDPDYQRVVAEAARDFPDSTELQRLNLALHSASSDRLTYLMRYVASQFPNVAEHLTGPYRLSDFMAALKNESGALRK